MRRTTSAAAAAALLVVLTACGTSADDSDSTPAKKSATTADEPTKATPSPTRASGPLTLGGSFTWSGPALDEKTPTTGTTTVTSYSHDLAVKGWSSEALGVEDPLWVAVEVKVCNQKGGVIEVSQGPWSLGFPDDSRVVSMFLVGSGLPKPEYPTEGVKVKPGDCIRGKIPFVLEKGQRPDRIIYQTFNTPEPVEWAVPKA